MYKLRGFFHGSLAAAELTPSPWPFSRENRSHQPSLSLCSFFLNFLFPTQVPTFFSFAVAKSCDSNHSFEDFIVELRICLPVPVPEFLRSFLVLPEVLPNKGTLGCKHLCFDATSDQLCTRPMKLKWKISPSLHDGVEKLQHFLCHCCILHLRPAQWMYDELARIIYRNLASVHLVLLAHGSKWWQVWVWSWGLLGRWCRWAQKCKSPTL